MTSVAGRSQPISTVSARILRVRSRAGVLHPVPAKWSFGRSRRGHYGWLTHRMAALSIGPLERGEAWLEKARSQLHLHRTLCSCQHCPFSLSDNTT